MAYLFVFFRYLVVLISFISFIGCASTPTAEKVPSYTIPFDSQTQLASQALPYINKHPEQTGFYPLGDGQEAFLARLALIYGAEHSIDLQYYIYRDDSTSSLMTYALYQAAERGVRVRLLLDDMQSRNDKSMAQLASHPNIKIRLFNPFENRSARVFGFITDFERLNRRMHNKALIADNAFVITGGRNIGDEYFAANTSVDFGDFDILMLGQSVTDVAVQFDMYWNSKPSTPIESFVYDAAKPTKAEIESWEDSLKREFKNSKYIKSLAELPLTQHIKDESLDFFWGKAEVHYDLPSKIYSPEDTDLMLHQLGAILAKTNEELLLISPYFVPTKQGAAALVDAAQDGIDITIITNSLASNDVFAVHGWYAKYREPLLAGGVKLYEVKVDPSLKKQRSWLGSSRTSLHAKTFLIDRKDLFVGSFNFDPRSAYLNTEMGVLIESEEFGEIIYREIDRNLRKNTYRLALSEDNELEWHNDLSGTSKRSEPDASIWLRFSAWLAGILPIENQL
ncbi:phospholipase D family protein [Photobacterium rosenbergii]|uniref:Phospholipase D family protein n=1 Tax=Photobacterium rosenbergii TaxID=294936 RepID=A0ABU3ZCG3_9GAMM|nr:phospholipase D family protein [Photobacterium rosenbergii]MDV5167812.1 phospholipase D family protein [Photobacterium rosenbergii]